MYSCYSYCEKGILTCGILVEIGHVTFLQVLVPGCHQGEVLYVLKKSTVVEEGDEQLSREVRR